MSLLLDIRDLVFRREKGSHAMVSENSTRVDGDSFGVQASHQHWKTRNTSKNEESFSSQGKVRKFLNSSRKLGNFG